MIAIENRQQQGLHSMATREDMSRMRRAEGIDERRHMRRNFCLVLSIVLHGLGVLSQHGLFLRAAHAVSCHQPPQRRGEKRARIVDCPPIAVQCVISFIEEGICSRNLYNITHYSSTLQCNEGDHFQTKM
jgi:hypothetical protein